MCMVFVYFDLWITSFSDFLGNFWTYRNFPELLLHLVQFVLLAGSREQSGGIATLHSIDLNGRLEGQTVDIAWSTCKQAVSWRQWAVKKKYYLDQLRCRSDHRRAELADLMREREENACCENSKNRGVHRWSCGSLCIWRSTKLACQLSALAVIQVHWLVWIKRTQDRPFKSKKNNNNDYSFWKYLSYR